MFSFQKNPSPNQIGEGKPDSAVLFVHGLAGGYKSWNLFANHLKDKWGEADCFGLEYDEYYGSQGFLKKTPVVKTILKWRRVIIGPDIELLSRHLQTAVNVLCEEYENVIIAAHSMGGLVARKYIINMLEETKTVGKIRCLITYATPHHGSIFANYYLTICYYFLRSFTKDSLQITQLSKDNEFIEKLNRDWTDYRVDAKIDFQRVVGLEDWLVDAKSSSYKHDPNAFVIAGKDHFTIIKPDKRKNKDDAFMVLYVYLKNFRILYNNRLENEIGVDFDLD